MCFPLAPAQEARSKEPGARLRLARQEAMWTWEEGGLGAPNSWVTTPSTACPRQLGELLHQTASPSHPFWPLPLSPGIRAMQAYTQVVGDDGQKVWDPPTPSAVHAALPLVKVSQACAGC